MLSEKKTKTKTKKHNKTKSSFFPASKLLKLMFLGKDIVAVDSPLGRLGLTVCYDLRFPDLYQQLRFQHDAQV
jgi:predicted amidohydrolase